MKVKYKKIGNEIEEKEENLSLFLKEFHFLFLSKVVPSYEIVSDLCSSSHKAHGSGRIEWDRFEITYDDYCEAVKMLIRTKSLVKSNIPDEINTAYKWSIWQYEVSYGIPYEEHKRLADIETENRRRLYTAIEAGDEEKKIEFHLKSVSAGEELSDFLNDYLDR